MLKAARFARPDQFEDNLNQSRAGLVPQQFVDRGLGAGALVDALDDDGTGGGGARLAVLERPAGQGAGHHHGVFGDLADESLAGLAVDDLGGGAEDRKSTRLNSSHTVIS